MINIKEDEAKTKWCPFGRVPRQTSGGAFNRAIEGHASRSSLCIGSECMAWQADTAFPETAKGHCGLMK